MTCRLGALGLLLAAAGGRLEAQLEPDDRTDVQTRLEAGLRMDLPRRWEGELGYRARYVGDARTYRSSDLSAGLERGVGRGFALIGGYRLRLGSDGTAHRITGGAELRRRLVDTRFSLRALTQYETKHSAGDESRDRETSLRVRLRAQQPFGSSFSVAASIEPVFDVRSRGTQGLRHGVDVRYAWSARNRVELSYLLRRRLGDRTPRTDHVVGLGVQHTIKVRGR